MSIQHSPAQQWAGKFSSYHKAFNAASKGSSGKFNNGSKCFKSVSSTGERSIAAQFSDRSSVGSHNALILISSDIKTQESTESSHCKLLLPFSLLQLLRSPLLPQIFAVTKTQGKHTLWNPSAVPSQSHGNRSLHAQSKARWLFFFHVICRRVCLRLLWIYESKSSTQAFLFWFWQGHTFGMTWTGPASSLNCFLYCSHNEFKPSAVNTSATLLLPSWC